MGDFTYKGELLRKLDSLKDELQFEGRESDILELVWALKRLVKEYFPMNEVPEDMINSLFVLEQRVRMAREQLTLTTERFILHLGKDKK